MLRLTFLSASLALCAAVGPETAVPQSEAVDGLRPFNAIIGNWRGVGQLKRGSNRGAWTEKLKCEWAFHQHQTSVSLKTEGGQQFDVMTLTRDDNGDDLVLVHTHNAAQTVYRGPMPKKWPGTVVLQTEPNNDNITHRCTIQQLSDIRTTVLFEKRSTPTGSFRRVAGVGYTRAGAQLAVPGSSQRKCIVTGGIGTIPVSHEGKTYYVCCQGCVQAFNAAPGEVIAEYRKSLPKK